MTQYLLSIYQPDGEPPPAPFLEKVMRDVRAVREQMKAAGAWVFAGGLHPPTTATVVRVKDGNALMTDGPYTEGQGAHRRILRHAASRSLDWGRKLAEAIAPLAIEVRPIQDDREHC